VRKEINILAALGAYRLAVWLMNRGDALRNKGRKRLAKWFHARGYEFIAVCMRAQRRAYSMIDRSRKGAAE
jgi:hypothetical protein